jgi:hypothetical protein
MLNEVSVCTCYAAHCSRVHLFTLATASYACIIL